MTLRPLSCGRAGLALVALALFACRDAGPTRLALRRGLSLPSEVEAGLTRSFAFELRRDQYLALRVTQEPPLDVVLTLHPPNTEGWAPLDTQTVMQVPELLRVVAPLDGLYVLEVEPSGDSAGPFRLEVVDLRPATALDRLTTKGQETLAQAEKLRRQNGESSDLRALPLYKEAVRLFGLAGDAESESYARVQWARVLGRRNHKKEAAASLRRCLALSAAAQSPGTRARAATMLAEVASDLGESTEAEAANREALQLWKQLGKITWEAEVVNRLAHHASERGELAKAESLYREALRLWETCGEASSAAVVLGNLASVYSLAGESQLALDTAEQGLARAPKDIAPGDRAGILAQKGEALANLGRREESQSTFLEALELLGKGEPAELAQLERRLARRAYDQGNYDEASKRFRSALTSFELAQDRQSVIATRQDLAWTELKRGHLEAAERLFQKTSAEAESSENRWIKPAALAGRARLARARGHLRPALALALQALDEVEGLRRELGRTDLKTSVFANQQSYFDYALDLTIELYDRTGDPSLLVEAFEISERSRARRLLDLLAARSPQLGGEPPQAEIQAAKALSRAEERLKALRSAKAAARRIEQAEREVRKAVLNLRREEGEPGMADPGFGGTPLSFLQIQRWVDRDTVLLEFDLGEDASYLWVVSRQHLSVHRLPPQKDVEKLARKTVGVLSAPGVSADSVQGQETLLAASRLLLGEAMTEIGARRWLLVMDGALHALPLGALPNPGNPEEPILAAHEISYAPSASVAVHLSERKHRPGEEPRKDLAVFADAVYEIGKLDTSDLALGSPPPTPGTGLFSLARLRYSDDEARHLLSLVRPEAQLDARRFAATKGRILSGELADYRLLHFAVHGLPNESHPELSGLALSLFDRQERPLDGILFAHEIARLHLPADLAVLSACHSGRGAAVSGEGLVGLAHAFFTAGTARVVASNWAVNDQATAELMGLFYDGLLRQGLTPARALQQAQLALSREKPWRRPYYWAGFVVQGGF
jgi:CHAT domain-containing protein